MTHDIELYAVDPLSDAEGIRLFRSDDTVYEAAQHGKTASRIYPEEGQWTVKVNVPVEERREAYDTFRRMADRLEDAYDVDLPKTWLEFQEEYEDTATAAEEGVALCYRNEGSLAIPDPGHEAAMGRGDAAMLGNLAGGGLGLASAGALGAMGSLPPEGSIIGIVGLGLSPAWGVLTALGANTGVPTVKNRIGRWKRRRRYGDIGALQDRSLLEHLNERNALKHLLDRNESFPADVTERYRELDDRALEAALDIITTAHFERFEELPGINVTASFDTYEEAAAFQDTVRDEDSGRYERPSIYTSPAAFRSMFDDLTFTVDGREYVLEDAEVLVQNVFERDPVDDAIITWLEEAYPDVVQDIGRDRSLTGKAL